MCRHPEGTIGESQRKNARRLTSLMHLAGSSLHNIKNFPCNGLLAALIVL